MKILVTGGAGFIGSHTVDLLIKKGYEVIVVDNLSSGEKVNINPKAVFYHIDLGNYKEVKKFFEKEKPDIVYHFAAQINIRLSVENPIFDAQINILNTINLIELCVKNNVKHFIFSSSGGAIYGDVKTPMDKNTIEYPISPYGCAKLSIEKYLNYYKEVYGLKYTILRYANVYGPRQNPKGEAGVISIFCNEMLKNENPEIWGGLQTRDFVYIEDVVLANILALRDNKSAIYDIGTGVETDIIGIFSELNKFFNNKFKPIYKDRRKGEQNRSCLNYKKINENLGWMPLNNVSEGIKKTYEWFVENQI